MRRIIQKYQEGGVVQPAVNTGLPQGGNAAAAIQSYLGGSSGGVSGPLSYTGSGGGDIPDYKSLAESRGALRRSLASSGLTESVQNSIMNEADVINTNITQTTAGRSGGGNKTTYGGHKDVAHVNIDNAFNNYQDDLRYGVVDADGNISGARPEDNPGYNADLAAAWAERNADNPNVSTANMSPEEVAARSMLSSGVKNIQGGYNQNDPTTGFTGAIKDAYGGITSGLNNAIDENALVRLLPGSSFLAALAPEISTYDPTPTSTPYVAPYVAPQNSGGNSGDRDQNRAMKELLDRSNLESNRSVGWDSAVGNTGGKVSHNNIGNNPPAGPLSYLNTGGISVANTGLREDEIRQRQAMQAKIQPEQPNALDQIGSKLAMGAVDKGIGAAASSLAAQGGMMGSLGSALGGTAASAATGGLGAGMMAALGPVGIGLGLGKLFGVFNYGGKVPYPKQKKSPLSGE